MEQNLHISRRAAALIYRRVGDHLEYDDLVAMGNAGLAEAANRFDPNAGASFSTYAWYRVQGAIIDGLRKATNIPRRTWAKLVALRAASEYLEHRSEREAGAVKAGIPTPNRGQALADLRGALSAIRTMYMTSLEGLREQGYDAEANEPRPDQTLHSAQLAAKLSAALNSLPDKERAVMTKYYWEGKTFVQAGAELGISKSWVSRLHAQAVERLRAVVDRTPHSLSGSAARPGEAGAIDRTPHSLSGSAARPGEAGAIDRTPHSLSGSAARPGEAGATDTNKRRS